MVFDPAGFLTPAANLANSGNDADRRTAVGRAYYAAYGTVRVGLAAAHGKTPDAMFGTKGKHWALSRAVAHTSAFKPLAVSYNKLLQARVRADYKYGVAFSKTDANSLIQDAQWVLDRLAKLSTKDFRSMVPPPP